MVLTLPPPHGVSVRPARNSDNRSLWARDPTGPDADNGTRVDATFVNDLIGLVRGLLAAYGIAANEGDDTALAQAVAAAIASHTHTVGELEDDEGYVRMTVAERQKLAALVTNYKGAYASLALLEAAHPTASAGDWAVLSLPGEPASIAVWDSDAEPPAWVDVDNAPPQTASNLAFTPAGTIEAATVQEAIEELDREKQPSSANLTEWASIAPAEKQNALGFTPREKLAGDRTYYVRTDGDDDNDGLTDSAGGAFLTIQKAVDACLALDLNGNDVTIQVGAGTYAAGVSLNKPFVGGNVEIIGDTTTPSNVVVSTTSADCFGISGSGTALTVKGFKLQTTTSGNCFNATHLAYVRFGNVEFGACAGRHLVANSGSVVSNEGVGNYTISGNAVDHMLATVGGKIVISSITITLSGTPAWSGNGLNAQATGLISIFGTTLSGSATGKRYSVTLNGVINTFGGGANYWPGDVAGTTAAGGQYA